jgi:hypothetical protein
MSAPHQARTSGGAVCFGKIDCSLQSVLPVASSDDPQSTFYLEKEFEARNTYNLYRQAERFDLVHAHWPTLAPYFSSFSKTPTVISHTRTLRKSYMSIIGSLRWRSTNNGMFRDFG